VTTACALWMSGQGCITEGSGEGGRRGRRGNVVARTEAVGGKGRSGAYGLMEVRLWRRNECSSGEG